MHLLGSVAGAHGLGAYLSDFGEGLVWALEHSCCELSASLSVLQ